jgi:predicted molibdopterin-dependent oxidoreductase YjgC
LKTPFRNAAEVMDEIAQVTPSWRGVSHARLKQTSPGGNGGLQYPVPHARHPGTDFLFDDRFPTADGKATFVGVEFLPPAELPDEDYPFMLNTGRQMYLAHGNDDVVVRAGRASPGHRRAEPADATALGVADGDEVVVASRRGEIRSRCDCRSAARKQVFIPCTTGKRR